VFGLPGGSLGVVGGGEVGGGVAPVGGWLGGWVRGSVGGFGGFGGGLVDGGRSPVVCHAAG
jgi:hypothetical protein